jgi:TRAP-type C4-dicarboxylate transport system permease large subunit
MDSFALPAIPLFILLSAPIAASHASKDLYETLHKWLYKIPGGLGIANMVGCGIFAALCGSSPATAAAIGGIGIPEMRRRGYSAGLATGLIAHVPGAAGGDPVCDHRPAGDRPVVHLAGIGHMAAEQNDRVDGGVNGWRNG